ncbi:MAG: carbohydrate ABC transporter substrate-binding protein, partial [Acetobacteraceae bacterium]|nr:carbohydrate ABC transporter substrate-binding protein [Acetobacteraceae bacterium]
MRLRHDMSVLMAALAVMVPTLAFAADPIKAEIVDNWGTGAERAAVQVIQDAFAARGGQLTSTVVSDGIQVMSSTVDRILAGDPPTAATFTPSSLYFDLENKGQLNDIDDVATADHWRDVLPPYVVESISYKGKIYIVPVSMTVTNWVYSNKELLAKAGVAALPKDYGDAFFAALDKLKGAGITPIGMGGTATVYRWVFESVMQTMGGRDLWLAVWDRKDEKAVRGPAMRKVFETFKRLRDYSDPGYSGRSWATATDLVVAGKAAISITGDWGKAEFVAAGKVPGKDFDCSLQGNPPMFVIHGDMFGFPKSTDPKVIAAQKLFARTVFDPAV